MFACDCRGLRQRTRHPSLPIFPTSFTVIVLDTFTAAGYITAATHEDEPQPPCLRVLHTSAASPVQNLNIYEPPNLAKGLSAAILSHTEIRSIPAYLILSLQESSYGKTLITDETLAAFVDGLRMLGLGASVEYGVAQQQARKLGSKLDGRVDQHHHRLYL
ncbi:hypothetical protein BC936DRAFT_136833 [Jimgerdemannia flammicorona]|uniref:Uncharacterized protein n=1 Tax=Jimgerdemannia flammicorona TaxID=994334 RepID=A0A433CYQ0_9FUNG|nr:hypothetical protein BC936DRAFT_136833 [Jimgerdemannia flammicorona]